MSREIFRKARRPDGTLLDAFDLPIGMPKADRPLDLVCPGCAHPVRARLGPEMPRHFFHYRPNPAHSCSRETILHQTAKIALWEAVRDLIASATPLTLIHPKGVTRITHRWDRTGSAAEFDETCRILETRDSDLEVERGELGFVADVRMRSPETTLFLEVAVTHSCSEEKIRSGLPILEYQIGSEEDILAMAAEVRTGTVRVGGKGDPSRTWNLDLEQVVETVAPPDRDSVLKVANARLQAGFKHGESVRLRNGTRTIVPVVSRYGYAGGRQAVTATFMDGLIVELEQALRSHYPGLLALLPDDLEAAANLLMDETGPRDWEPELVPVSPFDLTGRLEASLPEEFRDDLICDGTAEAWRTAFGIRNPVPTSGSPSRLTPAPRSRSDHPSETRRRAEHRSPLTPPARSSRSGSDRTRSVTLSVSRNGRLSLTRDGRVFGTEIGTFQVPEHLSDIEILDLAYRGKLGKVGFIRSCLGCRHHAFSHDAKKPIFCFVEKTSCHQTDAVGCDAWSRFRSEEELAAHRERIAASPKAPAIAQRLITAAAPA